MNVDTLINKKNAMIEEIKSRIDAGNRYFYSPGQMCRYRAVSRFHPVAGRTDPEGQ